MGGEVCGKTPDGLFYLVMELLAGETLTERLKRGRLHPLRALRYMHDIACGLDAAHEMGIVHRDVKPDNLFITLEDLIKILDFTAAKFFHAGLRTTEPAARIGTVMFMPPEAIEGRTTDARSDQYSLALCAYCMMRGKHPFARHVSNQYAVIKAQSEEKPEPLAECAGLPSRIDDLLAPALAKKIEKRYPTMGHFAQAIHEEMRWLAREMREGRLSFNTPLGEPPIDLDMFEEGARGSQRVYAAPEEVVHHTTAPVPPAERVSVAPDALPDAPASGGEDFDSAATAQLPTTTTAPVPPVMMSTTVVRRAPRSRRWIAALALALAVPAAAGLGWRFFGARLAAFDVTATVEPSTTADAPAPPAAPSVAVAEPPPRAEEPVAAVPSSPPPAQSPARRAPAGVFRARTSDPVIAEKRRDPPVPTAPAAAPTLPAATATPPPTGAPHRVFGSEN